MMAIQQKAIFGSVREISAVDYIDEVNKAGAGVWVVLHLYKSGYLNRKMDGLIRLTDGWMDGYSDR